MYIAVKCEILIWVIAKKIALLEDLKTKTDRKDYIYNLSEQTHRLNKMMDFCEISELPYAYISYEEYSMLENCWKEDDKE